jgi:hypothetical protein
LLVCTLLGPQEVKAMIPLRGVLLGIALTFAGTAAFLILVVRSLSRSASQAAIGLDVLFVMKGWMLYNPSYWLFVIMLLTSGFLIVTFRLRPIP